MCRLLAYASRRPTSLTEVLGAPGLAAFTALSRVHCDGWGLGWAEDDGVGVLRMPEPAHDSPEFARASQEHRADLAVAHVRWATDDLTIDLDNTHPFTDGRIAFAHNGAVRPADALDDLVPAELQTERRGTTDSERYFLAVLAEARRTDPATGLAAVVQAIVDGGYDYTCLNAILVTDRELIAVNRFLPAAEAVEGPEYYRMRYRTDSDAVVITSSGWGNGWSSLENGQLLVVQRQTLAVEIRDLAPLPVA